MLILLLTCLSKTLMMVQALAKDSDLYFLTSDSPIIHENLGVALLPSSLLAQGTENIYQSVFLTLESVTPPAKVCDLPCSPSSAVITQLTNSQDACWIDKMVIVKTSILSETERTSKGKCIVKCLADARCGAIAYDEENSQCITLTGNYYRVNAIDNTSTFATAKLSCILENERTTRSQVCGQSNELFDAILNSMTSQHDSLVERYVQKYHDVRKGYDLNLTTAQPDPDTVKRAWSDFDFLEKIPIIGHFYEILKSPSENRKLKEHMHDITNQFAQFAAQVKSQLQTSRKFENKILEIVDAGFSKAFEEIQGIKCDVASLAVLSIFQQSLKTHQSKLDELFYATKHGKLTASLPQTLTLDDLTLVLEQNPNFRDTIYVSHPEVLYRVGELYLMDVQKNRRNLLFHFLLTTPRLKPASIFRTYYPVQVPIASADSPLCFKPALPPTIIIQDDSLVAADITDCTMKEEMILCQQDFGDNFSPNVNKIPCLNDEPNLCTLENVPCDTTMLFTKAGALVYSADSILGMKVGETTQLTVLNQEQKYSYFFSWSTYKMIQSQQKVMYSLDNELVVKNLTWKSEKMSVDFHEYVKITAAKQIATNISRLQETLDNVTSIAEMDFKPNFLGLGISRRKWTDFTGMFSLVVTILSMLGFISVCCYSRIKKNNRLVRIVMDTMKQDRRERRMIKYNNPTLLEEQSMEDIVIKEPRRVQSVTHSARHFKRTSNVAKQEHCSKIPDSPTANPPIQLHPEPSTPEKEILTPKKEPARLPLQMTTSAQTEFVHVTPASTTEPHIEEIRTVTDAYGSL